jgi:hypothetical protein
MLGLWVPIHSWETKNDRELNPGRLLISFPNKLVLALNDLHIHHRVHSANAKSKSLLNFKKDSYTRAPLEDKDAPSGARLKNELFMSNKLTEK